MADPITSVITGLVTVTTVLSIAYMLRDRAHVQRLCVFQHVKTGGQYVVLKDGVFERDGKKCVIYVSVDELEHGKPWVRDYNEFFDGRFKFIGTMTVINGKKGKIVCA